MVTFLLSLFNFFANLFSKNSNHKGIKVAIVGPPHSGKSVLVGLLRGLLPRDKFCIVEGAPDGEGITGWSAEATQELTKAVRRKGKFLDEHVVWVVNSIRSSRIPITIVDLGGMLLTEDGTFSETGCQLTPQNKLFLQECTHFLVIANPKYSEVANTWINLCEGLGLQLFAKLESVLEGVDDEIFSETAGIKARVTKLDRNNPPYHSLTAKKLAEALLSLVTKHKGDDGRDADVNFVKLAKELTLPLRNSGGQDRDWNPGVMPLVSELIRGRMRNKLGRKLAGILFGFPIKLWGNTPAGFPYHTMACGKSKVAYCDPKLSGYVELPDLQTSQTSCNLLEWNKEERDNHSLIHFVIPKQIFDVKNLFKIVPPAVNCEKGVVVSGKAPRWLTGALCRAYSRAGVAWVACFEPQESGRKVNGHTWAEHNPGMGPAVVVASRDPLVPVGTVVPFQLPR